MIRNLLSSLLLTLITLTMNGQTIGISQINGLSTSAICLGQKVLISYTTKGNFNANNTFSIQAKSSYYSNTWVNLNTKDSSGYLVASLTKDVYSTLEKNINYTDFRIVSTSPSVISNAYTSQRVYTSATVEVLDIQKKILYPYETVAISLNLSGSAPINVVTSDSASFNIQYYDSNKYSLNVNPTKTEKYGISNVSNICGVGKASGGVDITVLNKMLQIVGISSTHVCKNSKIEVNFVKTGNWDADSKFILRLIDNTRFSNKQFDLTTTEMNGNLSANIPENLPLSTYFLQVIESKSGIKSNSYQTSISVHDELKVDIVTESTSMMYGQNKQLALDISGYGIYSIELSDGQIINQSILRDNSNSTAFYVSPKETTAYSIKSYSSTCGNGVGKNTVLLTVLKGIKINSIKAGKYCEGSTCEVKFSSNATFKIGSLVKVRLVDENNLNLGNSNYVETIGTVVRENVASFIIPQKLSEKITEYAFVYVNIYTDDIQSKSLSTERINVLSIPTVKLNQYTESGFASLTKPETTNFGVLLKGGGYYKITLSDGMQYSFEHPTISWETDINIPVYVPKTSTIAIKSITNVCGTNNDIKISKYVEVKNPEYSMKISSNNFQNVDICAGSKLDLTLQTTGNFSDNNVFTAELISNDNYNPNSNLGVIKSGASSITIPLDLTSGFYYIKVSSSNPLLYSNKLPIYVKTAPVITLNNYSYYNILAGESANIHQSISGGDTIRITYKDGSKAVYTDNGSFSINMNQILTKTTTFGVQSISNGCGVGTIQSSDITVKVAPYAINNNLESYRLNNSYTFHCQQNKLLVPFGFRGNVDKNASFSIQIAKYADTTFTTLLSGVKESPALVTIPDSFIAGDYSIRIVSSDNLVKSENSGLRLKTLLTSVLQLPDGKTETTINAGESITLASKSNNADYYYNHFRYVIQDDNNRKTIGENEYANIQETKYPTTNTTYSLISVINECGIGKASGTVKVTVKPVLNMKLNDNSSTNFCIGSSTNSTLNSVGTFANDNIFKVFIIDENNTRTELLSTPTNGVFNLVFGSNLKRGYYKMQIESSNPYQVKDLYSIFLSTKADVSLSGGAIINQGGVAALTIKNNDTHKPTNSNYYYSELLSYELSNGTSGEAYLNNSSNQTTFYVYPTTTQTYTIKSVKNVCGVGKADGTVTITVNPLSTKQTNIQNSFTTTFCAGSSLDITFSTKGAFTSNNKFTVQLSDKTGGNFKNLTTVGNTSPLKVKIPLDLPSGDGYLFRVMASDTGVSSSTNYIPYTALQAATARFDTSSYIFNENKPLAINIRFTGLPPFDFYIGSDEINAKRYTSSTNLYSITLNPLANSSYSLFSVINNTCGVGAIISPSTVRLELVTGIDELSKLGIRVFPNPTSDFIKIESNDKELKVQLSDVMGKIFEEKMLYGEDKQLDISQLNAGIYLLQIQKDGRQATFKIIKL